MLTNKQMWRKQRQMFQGMNLRRSFSDDGIMNALAASTDSCADSEITHRNSCSSLDSASGGDCSPDSTIKYSKQVEDLNLPPATLKKIKKKLRFDNLVRVTLIPSINEYRDAGLHLFLWCSQNELQCYKDSAYEDIKEFMRESECDNFTQAMKALFQVQNLPDPADCCDAGAPSVEAPAARLTTVFEGSMADPARPFHG